MCSTTAACLQALNITYHRHIIDGNEYVITTRTGEGTFLYDAVDIEAESVRWMRLDAVDGPWIYDDRYSYQEFVDHANPLTGVKDGPGDQHMTWEAAVLVAATDGIRLNNPGACTPMLTEAEFDLCLRAGNAARSDGRNRKP